MGVSDSPPASATDQDNITAIAYIRKSRCTNCGADMSAVIAEIKTGKIPPPKQCPSCQARFAASQIAEEISIYRCGNCRHQLFTADPQEEAFCSFCGYRLIYSGRHTPPKIQKK